MSESIWRLVIIVLCLPVPLLALALVCCLLPNPYGVRRELPKWRDRFDSEVGHE